MIKESSNRLRTLAEESEKTKKAREKLKKKFNEIDKQITPKALEKKSIEIHKWISRHAHERITFSTKSIALFDENQNAAKVSQKIAKLAESLQKSYEYH